MNRSISPRAAEQAARSSHVMEAEYKNKQLVIKSGKGANNLEAVLDFIKRKIQYGKIYLNCRH